MLSSKLSLAAAPAALLLSIVTGCGSDSKSDKAPNFDVEPKGLKSALETPIIDCQTAAADCLTQAGSLDEQIACNDTMAQCLQDAADRAQRIADRVVACREDGRQCVRDGNDLAQCRTDYEACTDAALNGDTVSADGGLGDGATEVPVTSVDGGVDSTPSTGNGSGQGGFNLPGLPNLPGLGGLGGLGGVDAGTDSQDGPVQCLIEMRLCISLDITQAQLCSDTARLCLSGP